MTGPGKAVDRQRIARERRFRSREITSRKTEPVRRNVPSRSTLKALGLLSGKKK